MAQLVKRLTLGFDSGHDPRVVSSSLHRACIVRAEPAWDSLSPSLSAPPPLALSLAHNKYKLKKNSLEARKQWAGMFKVLKEKKNGNQESCIWQNCLSKVRGKLILR